MSIHNIKCYMCPDALPLSEMHEIRPDSRMGSATVGTIYVCDLCMDDLTGQMLDAQQEFVSDEMEEDRPLSVWIQDADTYDPFAD